MTNEPTTEMRLEAALGALKALTGMMKIERPDSGPYRDKLCLCYVDPSETRRLILVGQPDTDESFLEVLGEALDNARMVTGELTFP